MDEFLDKRYELVKTEYFDELLVYLGYGYVHRKMARSLRPTQFLSQNKDGTYTISTTSTLYKSKVTFRSGEEFTETKPDGTKVRALIKIDGKKISHRQVEDNGRTLYHVYEYYPDKMLIHEITRLARLPPDVKQYA